MKTESNDGLKYPELPIRFLTKREYFAAMAMASVEKVNDLYSHNCDHLAKLSVEMADALIAELNKELK